MLGSFSVDAGMLQTFYVFVTVLGTGGLVAINWDWISRLYHHRPSNQFKELYPNLLDLSVMLMPYDDGPLKPKDYRTAIDVFMQLKALRISAPTVDEPRVLTRFVGDIAVLALTRKIRKARKRFPLAE